MSSYNNFKSTTVRGVFHNVDDTVGSHNAADSFQSDLSVGGDLILGTENSTTGEFGNITYTDTAGNINFKINGFDYSITPTILSNLIGLSSGAASQSYVQTQIANLVGSSPTTLDTLNELATSLNNDPNFATTVSTSIGLKAPSASPTFTGTVSGITKSMVGLLNVDNTSDVNKPVSTSQQTALDLKANLISPTFTGTVTGISKSMVGLSNVDNTTDIIKLSATQSNNNVWSGTNTFNSSLPTSTFHQLYQLN
jgi:hypothetical protein